MSNLLARLLLAVILLVSAPLLYVTVLFVLEMGLQRPDFEALFASSVIVAAWVVIGWILIWHSQVKWTSARGKMTFFSMLWSVGAAFLVGTLVNHLSVRGSPDLGVLSGFVCWFVVWLVSTVVIWRESAIERVRRLGEISDSALLCPACGYNLTGLHQARCPECGKQYTLDELFGQLRDRAVDLEQEQAATN